MACLSGAGGLGVEEHRTPKENLRSAGKPPQGIEAPPPMHPARSLQPKRNVMTRSMPTIPSRFEVTLYKGDREYKGFGSNALRFDGVQQEEIPGPGSYVQRKTLNQECNENVSLGKRGTGSFASRSVRFGARSLASLPRPGRGVPGPGNYDAPSALRYAKDSKDFNHAGCGGVFKSSGSKSKVPAAEAPGPGHYTSETRADAKEASAAQAAFKSASGRGVEVGEARNVPGPGMYFDGAVKAFPEADPESGVPTANFKPISRPRIARVHRDLPAADGRTREILGSFAEEVGKECVGATGAASKLPGPGHYDQDRDAVLHGSLTSVSGMSSFLPGTKRTDFAQAELGLLPGPGRYNPKRLDGGLKLTSATSAFNSVTDRGNAVEGTTAPGPAYYEPQLPKEHISFRMRPSIRQWLT